MWCGALRAAKVHAASRIRNTTPTTGSAAGSAAGSGSAYLYRFSRAIGDGAWVHHSDDIPFWFDAQAALSMAGALPSDFELAKVMSAALVSFVVAGDPGSDPPGGMASPITWPAYSMGQRAAITLDIVPNVTIDAHAAQCIFWDAHPYYNQESFSLPLASRWS